MTVYPPAKINIGLFVTEKRPDGFHNIETIFYPISLTDRLDIDISEAEEKLDFTCCGMGLDGDSAANLCCKAYHMLDADYNLPPVKMRLYKNIPVGAGLGGGSSDAAYTLKALNHLFDLQIPDERIAAYASRLGSDCAFFAQNKPALGTGKGDILEPVPVSLSGYHILLVKPSVFVSTADAYSLVKPNLKQQCLQELIQLPIDKWKEYITNDFEKSVFVKFPEIKQIKEKMYNAGAAYASMSGSGSSVYGLFRTISLNVNQLFSDCFVWNDFDSFSAH